ncbi:MULTISPECIES: MFS transporter [unclassified Microcoleus]|uniref:MFS transporter n=1 Tax=unclassified Microcoleus TaxID=2642155 RepID=UPI002FD2E562
MVEPVAELNEPLSLQTAEIVDPKIFQLVLSPKTALKFSKKDVRSTLKASTLDGVLAAVFESATTGVLLSNFLLQLGASSVEIGIFFAIPMVVNLLQPLGAYIAAQTTSRRWYNLFVFSVSRLLWLVFAMAIVWGSQYADPHQMLQWTLLTVVAASVLGAFANSNWFSWMAAVVPHRLRGRYFGFRNSAVSLITLLGVPLMGWGVSTWGADPILGYGIVLLVGVLAGMISLTCQLFMVDVNPQLYKKDAERHRVTNKKEKQITDFVPSVLKDSNFLMFILYFSVWTFAINLSAPFFNIYLLKNLSLDVSLVTIYTSLSSGANLLLLMFWGKLADRWGNRPLLIAVGLVVALTPLLWLGTGNYPFAVWVWLPLLHLLGGTTLGAIGLCTNNIQMEIAPLEQPSTYFAIGAAVSGVAGALGTTAGGFLAQLPGMSLGSVFALSAAVRFVGLLPLILVREPRSQSLRSIVPTFGRFKFNRG